MKHIKFFTAIILAFSFLTCLKTKAQEANNSFSVGKNEFLLNGKSFLIKAAELHYPRIPREYWDHRIKLAKALGMNTICLYTFWNLHEEREGEFDFSGNKDLREFVILCQQNHMKVILRPGPYVCAEWEMGGLPWWLLKNKDVKLRENDPFFLDKVRIFENEVASQLSDLTIQNGGPIIMIQVENEYGAYGEDKEYIDIIRSILKNLYGDEIVMFQCDWSSNFTLNGLDDLLWTMNFGTGADIDSQFKELKELRPESPLMCSEYWSGWFDKWGAPHETRDANEMIAGIDEMLAKNISFSLYMTHGGTNRGHWAGANSPGYSPDVTSYDYDAPINEYGHPTDKYMLLRETLAKYQEPGQETIAVPESPKTVPVAAFELTEFAPIFENLPEVIEDTKIRSMEEYDMGFGTILYSTLISPTAENSILKVIEPHDYAQIFINGQLIGILDRRFGETEIVLPEIKEESRLDILVEATGRINFGREIKDYKGITEKVTLTRPNMATEENLQNWNVYLFPDDLNFYESRDFRKIEANIETAEYKYPPGIYKGKFTVYNIGDTFLNFENWGKGLVYINGMGIGRIWNIGPQQTIYVPGPWLKEGENEILIFDVTGPKSLKIEGYDYPVLDKLQPDSGTSRNEIQQIDLSGREPVVSSSFPEGAGWKQITFDQQVAGRRLVLLIESTNSKENIAAIAELYLLGENGKRIDREKWKTAADSENSNTGNHSAQKAYDLQESTYWESEPNKDGEHFFIIDLGEETVIHGLQLLPRVEKGNPGAIKEYKIFIE